VPPAFSPIFGELDLIRPIDVALGADSVSQWFGENISYYATLGFPGGHPGIDYRCPIGTRVKATHDGTLIWGDEGAKGYGLYAMVQGQYITTLYGHLSSILRPWKQQVKQGDEIALSGNSGNSTGPHLHFEVMIAGGSNPACKNRIDPKPFRTK
jgi:murein DD-endopeptidase MepM/ murein hydrolase activator NlpD